MATVSTGSARGVLPWAFVLARMRLARLVLWGAALGLMANLLDASREHFGGLNKLDERL